MNAAVSLVTQNATVLGSQIVIRSTLDYETAARAARNGQAFGRALDLIVKGMQKAGRCRIELEDLYGKSPTGLGTVESSSNVDATTTDVTFSTGTWTPGIWAGRKNAKVNFYTTADALVSSSTDAVFTISTITNSTRTIRVTGTATGITALDAAAAGDLYIFFQDAHDEGASGVDAILTNTGSLNGIDASVYDLWLANTFAVNGAMTFAKLEDGTSEAVGRGMGGNSVLYVNPRVFGQLVTNEAAARVYDSSYNDGRRGKNGFSALEFACTNGVVRVEPHAYVKPQDGFLLDLKTWQRIGATDLTFNTPGKGGEIFRQLDDAAGFELRNYSFQAPFCDMPAANLKFTGITL